MNYRRLKQKMESEYNGRVNNLEKHLGESLRKRRLELKLTQSDASAGICSVSYLSKVENSKMLPNRLFIREMSKRMGMDLDAFIKSSTDTEILDEGIKAYYHREVGTLSRLKDNVKAASHPTLQSVFALMLAHLKGEKDECDSLISTLMPVFTGRNLRASTVVVIVAIIHAFEQRTYRHAFSLLRTLEGCEEALKPRLKALKHMYAFLIKQKTGCLTSSISDYEQAVRLMSDYPSPHHLLIIQLYRIHQMTFENSKDAMKAFLNISMEMIPDTHINMYRALQLKMIPEIALKQPEGFISCLNHERRDTWFYRALASLSHLAPSAQLKAKLAPHFEDVRRPHLPEKMYFEGAFIEKGEAEHDFLKNVCLPIIMRCEEYEYIDHFTRRLSDLSMEQSRYKEAMSILRRRHRLLSSLSQVHA